MRLEASILLCILCLPQRTYAAPVDQVAVIRIDRKARVKVSFEPGDRTVYLSIFRGTEAIVQQLEQQRGPALTEIERLHKIGNTLSVALHLSSDRYGVSGRYLRMKNGRRSAKYSLSFRPHTTSRAFSPAHLIGQIPRTPPQEPWPHVTPPLPRRHPCQNNPRALQFLATMADVSTKRANNILAYADRLRDSKCADFLIARYAELRLRQSIDHSSFARWAFELSRRQRWAEFPYAYSYVALIAADILLQQRYHPEAEALLASQRIQSSEKLVPYRAILMSDLLVQKRQTAVAKQLLRALLRQRSAPTIQDAVAIRLIDLSSGDAPQRRKNVLGRLSSSAAETSSYTSALALRLGELALTLGEIKSAEVHFRRAVESRKPGHQSYAHLRLGDIELRRSKARSSRRALRRYQRVGLEQSCLYRMAQLRQAILKEPNKTALEQRFVRASSSNCPGLVLEARYALAALLLHQRRYSEALTATRIYPDLSQAHPNAAELFRSMIQKVGREGIEYLYRNRQWLAITQIYDRQADLLQDVVSAKSLRQVAEGFAQIGMNYEGSQVLQQALKRKPTSTETDAVTIQLAQTYLASDNDYMAELVLGYRRHIPKSPNKWRAALMRAELYIRQDNGEASSNILLRAKASTPAGDPTAEWMMLNAETQFLLNQGAKAGRTLSALLQRDWYPSLSVRGRGVKILSSCARQCSVKDLEQVLKALRRKGHSDLVNSRIRYLSKRRGVRSEQGIENNTIWKRLDEVVPDTLVP